MSIRAMTWAFSLPLEPRAKLALLAIADNARDDGVAWPSRDIIAEKSSQSRSTVGRRLKYLAELGILIIKERFRADGTQTTDEIHLDLSLSPAEVLRKMHDAGTQNEAEEGEEKPAPAAEDGGPDVEDVENIDEGGGCQPDTLGYHSGHPRVSVVTGGGLQSGHPLMNRHLNQESPPTPSGGRVSDDGPLKKPDKDAIEKRSALWDRFAAGYPGIATMDQQLARSEFEQMSIDDAEWAVSVLVPLKDDIHKLRKPPKNAHLWLRKGMFRNYPRAKLEAPPPDEVWIAEGSDEDRALRFVRSLAKVPNPFIRTQADGTRGYPNKTAVGADLLAMLEFFNDVTLSWNGYPRGTPRFEAWQTRFQQWTGHRRPTEPGSDCIRVPCPWPPKKDGTIYRDDEEPVDEATSEGSAS